MMRPQPSPADFAAAFTGPDGPDMLNCALFASVGGYLRRFFASDYVLGPMAYGAMSGSAARSSSLTLSTAVPISMRRTRTAS